METWEMILIVIVIVLAGLALFYLALRLTERRTKKKVALHRIFKDFGQKMWMTAGLGLVFFCLFLLTAILGSYFDDPQSRLNLFFLMYEHPTVFIYLGLFTFALTSTSIYLVRLVIKYLYNTKRKY